MKKSDTTNAFSIVEMMISLVAISVLLAAFVPVITKRVKPSIHTAASFSNPTFNPTPNCSEPFSDYCLYCNGTKECILCTIPCPAGTTKNSKTCTCESCSDTNSCTECPDGLYLENGACNPCPDGSFCIDSTKSPCPEGSYCKDGIKTACDPGKWSTAGSSTECTDSCPEGSYCIDGVKTPCEPGKWSTAGSSIECTDNCPEGFACKDGVKIQCEPGTYVSSTGDTCSPCESDYYCPDGKTHPSCESKTPNCATCDAISGDCNGCAPSYELKDLKCELNCPSWAMPLGESGVCMSRFNIGDFVNGVGVDIPTAANVTVVRADRRCNDDYEKCCWQGATTNQSECDSEGGNYSGCYRTQCTWFAANAICTALGGSLPTVAQLEDAMKNYSKNKGNDGFQFCDYRRYAGSSYCDLGQDDKCMDSYFGYCIPNEVWSVNSSSAGYARHVELRYGGVSSDTVTNKENALSVRCIIN